VAISLDHYLPPSHLTDPASELRLMYQLFEDAQRARIAHGERLRAFLQGRSFAGAGETERDIDGALKVIANGETVGAPRILERAYARAIDDQETLAVELRSLVEQHPAWGWLGHTKGIGHLLAARLLARLDVVRARTPSAFWAYCGLSTIPGVAYRCAKCGLEVAYPTSYQLKGTHTSRRGSKECVGQLDPIAADVRVAPRRTTAGGRAGYDAHARKSCYLVGVSMLRCGSSYKSLYDEERARLAIERPGWTPKRCHLSALRKMEKAFLRDLWVAWRKAVNLPVVAPYFPRIEYQV
jgi:hypothetical protein